MKRINLDIVRIFAGFMVLSVHIAQYVGLDFSVGAKGVQLFFVLSGYLAFTSLDNESSPVKYYKKRLVRIVPSYWLCLVLLYLEDLIIGFIINKEFNEQCGWRFIRYFFFAQCFTPTKNWNMWNNHSALWTMSSFAFFYFVAPFLYKTINKFYYGLTVLFVFMIGTPYIAEIIKIRLCTYPDEAHIEWFAYMNPLAELYCFLLGAVLFIAMKEHKSVIFALLLSIALIVKGFSWYSYEILFTLVILIVASFEPVTSDVKICKGISFVSGGVFSLYLIHPMILRVTPVIWRVMNLDNNILYMIFLYIMCIGISYFLHFFIIVKIERVLNKGKQEVLKKD